MEIDIYKSQPSLAGIIFTNKVIYNIVQEDSDFLNTGLSIINHLKRDKNKYVATIIESQSYDCIKTIYDDCIKFGPFYDLNNENREEFSSFMNILHNSEDFEYMYFLDLDSDTLIVKIPEIVTTYALDYNNSEDVRKLINLIK